MSEEEPPPSDEREWLKSLFWIFASPLGVGLLVILPRELTQGLELSLLGIALLAILFVIGLFKSRLCSKNEGLGSLVEEAMVFTLIQCFVAPVIVIALFFAACATGSIGL